mgnify:CR=1 FL=1
MKYNKRKGFTLAEIMVLLATLTVLMAAFAPVFTRRYTATSLDDVWTFVPGDAQNDAYYDASNKKYTAQAFIGLTPVSKSDVNTMTKDDDSKSSYAKVVVAASKSVNAGGGRHVQNQFQFRYGNSAAGTLLGNLFAGNNNLLLGGKYDKLSVLTNPNGNTAYGYNALSALTNGDYNTAVGVNALSSISSGKANVGVGNNAGATLNGNNNTILGTNAGSSLGVNSEGNTIIGSNAGQKVNGNRNTSIGDLSLFQAVGSGNTAVGSNALYDLTSGGQNVAVGGNSMSNLTSGSYNTAIGYNSCLSLTSGSYKTCIGVNSGSPKSMKAPYSNLFSGDTERVFIGTIPENNVKKDVPAAVLEVHNVKGSTNSNALPIQNTGNESVIVNGNLIVRGQTYLETIIYRYGYIKRNLGQTRYANKGLVWYMSDVAGKNSRGQQIYGFMGYDGIRRDGHSYQTCRNCGRGRHDYSDIRNNCICTAVAGPGTLTTTFEGGSGNVGVSKSYDWTSQTNNYNGTVSGNCDADCDNCNNKAYYTDRSYNSTVYLERRPHAGVEWNGTDRPLAHMKGVESCCPDLVSDIRLKNVGEKFTGGLAEIKKLNVYNYTFKNDPNKLPQVGVIAQDLKMVFPNAVTKGEDGYYKIRWDEMLYSAINAVKELNTKVINIARRIESDRNRVANLKKDNAELNAQLDKLADEVTALETKKHK